MKWVGLKRSHGLWRNWTSMRWESWHWGVEFHRLVHGRPLVTLHVLLLLSKNLALPSWNSGTRSECALHRPWHLAWGPSWKMFACAGGLRNVPRGTKCPEGALPGPRAQANVFNLVPKAQCQGPTWLHHWHWFTCSLWHLLCIFWSHENDSVKPQTQTSPMWVQIESHKVQIVQKMFVVMQIPCAMLALVQHKWTLDKRPCDIVPMHELCSSNVAKCCSNTCQHCGHCVLHWPGHSCPWARFFALRLGHCFSNRSRRPDRKG